MKCVVSHFHNAGWRPVVAAELEFSLVHYNREGIHHTCPRPAGGAPIGGNTYGLDVLHSNAVLLEDIRRACEIQDLPFDGIVKESAPSQYEINMQHVANPVLAADQIQMLKRLIKGVAAKHGLIASFMAKPFENEAGNGMHVHCSILDELGDNIFDDGSGLGIEQKLDPGPPIEGDGYQQAGKPLPQYLPDAIHLFEKSEFIRRNLGEELQRIYSLSKHQENAEFRRRISELEYQSYLEKL